MMITLPYPPTANNATAVVRGRKVKSRQCRNYAEQVYAEWLRSGCPRLRAERYSLRLLVMPPDNRRRDIANTEKVIVDSLVACGALPDDHRIHRMLLVRGPVVAGGRVLVRARELNTKETT